MKVASTRMPIQVRISEARFRPAESDATAFPWRSRRRFWTGPRLGEHNEEVLARMLGMGRSEMLAAQGRQEREQP